MAKNKFTIEEGFDELEQIISSLENPELGLSESMALYKKGVKLLDKCNQALDKTEKEMIILQEGYNGSIHEGENFE